MRLCFLPLLLALTGCHVPAMVAISVGATIADKLLGVTDAAVALVKTPTTTPPAPVAPQATGWALNGDRQ